MSTLVTPGDVSFMEVFAAALRGHPCVVLGLGQEPMPLPVPRWIRCADDSDRAVLSHCHGPTLDVGCGPGRMGAHLADLGLRVLAIDVVGEAVNQARSRGVTTLQRDVFDALPDEGGWGTVLLADGNIGIGGDPVRLLGRARDLLTPHGRVVVDLAPFGTGLQTRQLRLGTRLQRSMPFPWSTVGADAIAAVADAASLLVVATHEYAGRWFSVLRKA